MSKYSLEQEREEIYQEWLDGTSRGLTWQQSRELWEDIGRKREEQAAAVARRLLGNQIKFGDVPAGENITNVCSKAAKMAAERGRPVAVQFNDTCFTVFPQDTQNRAVERFWEERGN